VRSHSCVPVADAALAEQPYFQPFCSNVTIGLKIFYLAWRENGLADFGEIWQIGPSWTLVVCLGKSAPQTHPLPSDSRKTSKIAYYMPNAKAATAFNEIGCVCVAAHKKVCFRFLI